MIDEVGISRIWENGQIGTTGWEGQRDLVRALVEEAGVGCIYAANFSLGMQLFYRLVTAASQIFTSFPQHNVSGHEIYHKEKAASSGYGTSSFVSVIESDGMTGGASLKNHGGPPAAIR